MIKQILFDCGGVLAQMRLRDVMLKISGSEDVADYFIRNIWSKGSPWLRFDKGEISILEVVVELKKFMPEICPTYVEEIVNNWFDGLPVMDGMEEIVDDTMANIESAKKMGLEGYVFTTPAAFCNYLKEQKILPSI